MWREEIGTRSAMVPSAFWEIFTYYCSVLQYWDALWWWAESVNCKW